MNLINVVIIENENMSRVGAATILSETGKIHVCGLAKYAKEGIEIIDKQRPDVVVLNIDLPEISGIDIAGIIKYKYESMKIVVMTANSSREAISTAISNGADCYYCKNSAREEVGERFIEAILAAYNNESWIDPTINRIFLESFRSKDPLENKSIDFLNEFSIKEIGILKLTAEGMKNDEIANQMYVSEGTVRSYLHSLYTKLDVKDRLNAIRKGIQLGILTFSDLKIEQEIIQDTYPEAKTNRKSKVSKAKETNKGYKGWAA